MSDAISRLRQALENPRLSDCEWVDEQNLHWHHPTTYVQAPEFGHKVMLVRSLGDFTCTVGKSENEWANAAYIAAANPSAIREVLDLLDAAEKDAGRWRYVQSNTCAVRGLFGEGAFVLPKIAPLSGSNLMKGVVCQHLDAAVDAAISARASTATKGVL